MRDFFDLLSRLFIAFLFVYEAYDALVYVKATKEKMTAYGLLWQQDFFFWAMMTLLVIGAIFLSIGYRARFAAFCLLVYWLPLTFVVHSFWNDPPDIRRVQSILFMRNIAIAGGLMMISMHGSGRFSIKRLLDSRRIRSED